MSDSYATRRKALSATSTSTWKQCQLKFRLIYIDGFKEPPSLVTARGTLVHSVLEEIFNLPPNQRQVQAAREMINPSYQKLLENDPQIETLFTDETLQTQWFSEVEKLVESYFKIENPQRLEPYARELLVDAETASGIALRGFIDRIDKAPSGAIRIVDYKTGKSPRPQYLEDKLHQMRFYSLLMQRAGHGIPARTQLVFLTDGKILTFDPQPTQIEAFEHYLEQLWNQIENACQTGNFYPRKQPLCNWCGVKEHCPVFGKEPPEIEASKVKELLTISKRPQ
ncbi:PD-(D/E)XK nuclease family protein [Gleimia sp. 6138-11-ORH1]|uniref:RecB family exonuclease n=1 Tax=Gleimia sp. 6138-11-ORH1 TaxID=2973937 RepID=UPI002168A39E|nr:PD-(D/E)XK nuclease family protein [Gleimia sp. 6138-11-ORH1]MCS4484286.1 PD-(D/E)XK nuclease family protein [Gleimia sp. 6138-11-ORH1]